MRHPTAAELLDSCPDTPGAYLHVPFCTSLCPFCPYNKVVYEPGRVARYFRGLTQEVQRWVGASSEPFTSLYVGGGTPSLCLDELEPLVAQIPVAGERAMELLPVHVTEARVERLKAMGFDFASVGVQSFDSAVLEHLGRAGNADLHRKAVTLALRHFTAVDVDLIFDVGFAHPERFLDDVRTCFELGAHQVSTYPLMRFGFTPFGSAPHAAAKEHALLRRAETIAREHGYERRSVWTFNRIDAPNYTSITRDLFIGMGASAASYTGRWFTVNHFSPERYAEACISGLPLAQAHALPGPIAALYWLFWQAYAGSVDLRRLEDWFGSPAPTLLLLRGMERLGWGRTEGGPRGIWRLTPKGRDRYHDVERWVTEHYIEPLWADLLREYPARDRPPGLRPRPSLSRRIQRRVPFLPARG